VQGNVKNFEHNPAMSIEVFEVIKPIYEELCSDELTRCLGGFTQNSNESLNSLV